HNHQHVSSSSSSKKIAVQCTGGVDLVEAAGDDLRRGAWTAEEDEKLLAYVGSHGTGHWRSVGRKAGLQRCGKSCRLRWTNYLRPNIRHGSFTPDEEDLIVKLHSSLGSRWSLIAAKMPGRTDNDIKNHWNTRLKKKLSDSNNHTTMCVTCILCPSVNLLTQLISPSKTTFLCNLVESPMAKTTPNSISLKP
ncbi:unnamed protein product, partial [Sphagnum compactum]